MVRVNYYEQPQCEVIELQMQQVIADSDVTVTDPWGNNTETQW